MEQGQTFCRNCGQSLTPAEDKRARKNSPNFELGKLGDDLRLTGWVALVVGVIGIIGDLFGGLLSSVTLPIYIILTTIGSVIVSVSRYLRRRRDAVE